MRFDGKSLRLIALLLLLVSGSAAQARRIAIIIANETYANEARLSNPVRDARAIAAALGPQGAKFDEVRLLTNLDLRGMRRAIQAIAATAGADALVVYYSGHGIRDDARRNFLLPVEANISRPEDIAVDGIDAEDLVQAVRAAQPKLGLIVLDACRNNPFIAAFGNRSTSKGLARRGSDGLNGVLVAYAADGGQVADDGRAGLGSPFATAFARRIATPGTPLLALLDEIADDVVAATGGKQTPTRDGNLRANAMLVPAVLNRPVAPPPVVLASIDLEREMWDLCKVAAVAGPCRAYLNRYASGTFAELAKLRLDSLEPPPVRPVTGTTGAMTAGQLFQAGYNHEIGKGVPQNLAEAARLYKLAADLGNASAQNNLGVLYKAGTGVPQNNVEAARLYKLAADQGNASAQNNLGVLYETGNGVPKSFAEAARLYKLAADQGKASAQNNLGILYEGGTGVPQNLTEAARLYRLAADQGSAIAQKNLGVLYEDGKGVPQNLAEAARFYKLAADQGHAGAQNNLGLLYRNGAGVPQNFTEAARLYKLAADQGNVSAQNNLGVLYEDGKGVPQNLAEATRLYKLAANQGMEKAAANLKRLGIAP